MKKPAVRLADRQKRPVDRRRLVRLLAFGRDRLGLTGDLSLALVDDARMEDLNRRFAGHAGTTDVLAFPLEDANAPDPEPELGEIVVSTDTAARQAAEMGHAFARELALLALHGLLHLAGRDDAEPAARRDMLREGETLLDAFEAGAGTGEPRTRG
jgi:probable rRNA maturation factor